VKKLVVLIAIITILISTTSCCSATATPIETVNAYWDAWAPLDPQAMVSYETEDCNGMTRAQRLESYEAEYERGLSISYTNRSFVVESETTTTATVRATFDFLIAYNGVRTQELLNYRTDVDLTKVDGKWLIRRVEGRRGTPPPPPPQ